MPHSHASASRYPSAATDAPINWLHSGSNASAFSVASITDQSDGGQEMLFGFSVFGVTVRLLARRWKCMEGKTLRGLELQTTKNATDFTDHHGSTFLNGLSVEIRVIRGVLLMESGTDLWSRGLTSPVPPQSLGPRAVRA